jgi:sigma-B regulation protein RsbU (phosphoserine phosphatase)
MRIRYKLILAIGLPLLVLLALMVFSDYFALRRLTRAQIEERLQEVAERYAARFDGHFRAIAGGVRTVAATLETDTDLSERQIYSILRGVLQADPLIFGSAAAFAPGAFPGEYRQREGDAPVDIPEAPHAETRPPGGLFAPYVFRASTAPATSPEPGLQRLDLARSYDYTQPFAEWFVTPMASGEAGWTAPYFDAGGGNVIMVTFSAPVQREGRRVGVVTADVALETLRQNTLRQTPADISLFIVDRQGNTILAPDAADLMSLNLKDLAAQPGAEGLDELFQSLQGGRRGVMSVTAPRDRARYIVFTSRIEATGWFLIGAIPEERVMAPVLTMLAQRVGFGVLVIAVILAVVLGLGMWIVAPIRRLAEAVRGLSVSAMAAGEASVPRVAAGGDEVGDLSRAFESMVGHMREQVEALTRETQAREAVESELRLARSIQVSLLPTKFPDHPHYALFAMSAPARFVGGDFFDYQVLEDGCVNIVVADVSGKGVPAAMFMAVTRTVLRDLGTGDRQPGEILTRANALLMDANNECMFVTVFLARFDPRTGVLRFANAGHPPPQLIPAAGPVREVATSTGTVLGAIENQTFSQGELTLARGERLVLYTDGVSEARNSEGAFLAAAGLAQILAAARNHRPDELCRAVVAQVEAFESGPRHDDTTVLVLERR